MDELQQLQSQAAALDAELNTPAASLPPPGQTIEPAAVEPAAVDPLAEARDLIQFSVTLLAPLYPSVERIYTKDTQEKLAKVSAPLMAKYGLTLSGLFEKWGAEINFALVAIPLALETAKGIRADLDAVKAEHQKPADASPKNQPEQ